MSREVWGRMPRGMRQAASREVPRAGRRGVGAVARCAVCVTRRRAVVSRVQRGTSRREVDSRYEVASREVRGREEKVRGPPCPWVTRCKPYFTHTARMSYSVFKTSPFQCHGPFFNAYMLLLKPFSGGQGPNHESDRKGVSI